MYTHLKINLVCSILLMVDGLGIMHTHICNISPHVYFPYGPSQLQHWYVMYPWTIKWMSSQMTINENKIFLFIANTSNLHCCITFHSFLTTIDKYIRTRPIHTHWYYSPHYKVFLPGFLSEATYKTRKQEKW